MAINASVQYNDGLLPDMIMLTQCFYHWGTRNKCHEEVLSLQPMIPPKRFDIFLLRGSRCVQSDFSLNIALGQNIVHVSGHKL